jgi:hypothetical protein
VLQQLQQFRAPMRTAPFHQLASFFEDTSMRLDCLI